MYYWITQQLNDNQVFYLCFSMLVNTSKEVYSKAWQKIIKTRI